MTSQLDAALDAAGTAADYSARATFMRGYEAGQASVPSSAKKAQAQIDSLTAELDAAKAEAIAQKKYIQDAQELVIYNTNTMNAAEAKRDTAEKMVAEMKEAMMLVVGFLEHRKDSSAPAIRAAIDTASPIADRWRPASDFDDLSNARDACNDQLNVALDERDDAEARAKKHMLERDMNVTASVKAEAERDTAIARAESAMIILRELVDGAKGLNDLGLEMYDIRPLIERARDIAKGDS
jgi:hypothetical protein